MSIRSRILLLAVLAVPASLAAVGPVAAAGDTLRLEPAAVTVASGSSFTVRVVQNISQPTSGTQASIVFDPHVLQIALVTRAELFRIAPINEPSDMAGAIARANRSGKLGTVATVLVPPDSVPTGDQDFLLITFKAIGCGASRLDLPAGPNDGIVLDGRKATYGQTLTVTTAGADVTVNCGPGSTPTTSALPGSTDAGGPPAWLMAVIAILVVLGVGGLAGLVLYLRRPGPPDGSQDPAATPRRPRRPAPDEVTGRPLRRRQRPSSD